MNNDIMRKILWITADSQLSTDINYDLMSGVLKNFDVHWIVISNEYHHQYELSDFEKLISENTNLKVQFYYNNNRQRDWRNLLFVYSLVKKIKKIKYDIIYCNQVPNTPFYLPFYWWLPKNKTIFAVHDGSVKPSFHNVLVSKITFKLAYSFLKHVNMFSKTQEALFRKNYGNPDIYYIPLALEDFGKPTAKLREDNIISFVYFGIIHPDKNVGLLIDAANELAAEGVTGFKVSINGSWKETYDIYDRIKFPEVFELNLGFVPNGAIPNLFARNHFIVYPYKEMSQSGVLKVAYNYYTPVIVSDLPGFVNEVEENVSGFIFQSQDVTSLKNVIRKCITMEKESYDDLCNRMKDFVDRNYSGPVIAQKYVDMFNNVLEEK